MAVPVPLPVAAYPLHALLFNIFFVLSPLLAFLSQILSNNILYSPLLSLLSALSCFIKIFQYRISQYDIVLLYQFVTVLLLHAYLLSNYRLPLRQIELKVFLPALYARHGLVSTALILTVGALTCLNFLYLVGMGYLFGTIATLLDVFITFLQLLIYKDSPVKPTDSFVVWLAGDSLRLYLLLLVYKSPIEYSLATVAQMAMNGYVLYRHRRMK